MTEPESINAVARLQNQQFANLITFRRNGQPVTTPVWFAQEGTTLYVFTSISSGKIKRIRNNSAVQIGPSDRRGKPLGPVTNAQACIIAGAAAQHADALLVAKYGWQRRLVSLMVRLNKKSGGPSFIEITLSDD